MSALRWKFLKPNSSVLGKENLTRERKMILGWGLAQSSLYSQADIVVLFCFGQVSLCSPDWLRLTQNSGSSCLRAGITSSTAQLLGLLLRWPESFFWYLQSWAVEGKLLPAQVWLDILFIKQIENWRVKLCQMRKSLHSLKQTFSWQKCYCMFSLESLKICFG